jgi:hypothetical protein
MKDMKYKRGRCTIKGPFKSVFKGRPLFWLFPKGRKRGVIYLSFENFLGKKVPELKALQEWGKEFWTIDSNKVKLIFAQKGYEDKGYGHSQRIISNVGVLLGKYSDVLYQLNKLKKTYNSGRLFRSIFFRELKINLILFYIAAYLHDIGMNFAGIFEALSDLIAVGGDTALHIGEIIHNYHHYASFIVLFELNYLDQDGTPKDQAKCPYLSNISKNHTNKDNLLKYLGTLKGKLKDIYENEDALIKKFFEPEEFFVVLSILCLMHMDVNSDYVQSIIRKYKKEDNDERIRYFNKWWCLLERAKEWTEKFQEKVSDREKGEIKFSGKEEVVVKVGGDPTDILDLLFVEAMLQYGDKTEITIARLARKVRIKPGGNQKQQEYIIPLEHFREDTGYDNQKGFICTDMAPQVISSFARFRACRFIPLIFVDVQEVKEKGKIKEELDVIFHYVRFDNDGGVFRILRYHNEKDFFDLGFLDIIKIHIPMLFDYWPEKPGECPILEIEFKKKEDPINDFSKELNNLLKGFEDTLGGIKLIKETIKEEESQKQIDSRDYFPYTPQNCAAIFEFSKSILHPEEKKKTEGTKKAFCKTCDLIVPSSFELMAVLNLFQEEE